MKDLVKSKTFAGLLVIILGPVATRYGIDNASLSAIIDQGIIACGAALTIYGRVNAKQEIATIAGIRIKPKQ